LYGALVLTFEKIGMLQQVFPCISIYTPLSAQWSLALVSPIWIAILHLCSGHLWQSISMWVTLMEACALRF